MSTQKKQTARQKLECRNDSYSGGFAAFAISKVDAESR